MSARVSNKPAVLQGLKRGTGRIEQGRVYTISYDAPTCDEDGIIEAFWTGEIDTWGKATFKSINGGPAHYLFPHEIVTADPY